MLQEFGDFEDDNTIIGGSVTEDGMYVRRPMEQSTGKLFFQSGDFERMLEITEQLREASKPIVRRPHHARITSSLEYELSFYLLNSRIHRIVKPMISELLMASLRVELSRDEEGSNQRNMKLSAFICWFLLSRLALGGEDLEEEEERHNNCYTGGTEEGRDKWVNCNVAAEFYALTVPDDHPVILVHGPDDICNFAFNMYDHCVDEERITQTGDLRFMLKLFDLIQYSKIIKQTPKLLEKFPFFCSMIDSFDKYLQQMELVIDDAATEHDIMTGNRWHVETNAGLLRDIFFYNAFQNLSLQKPRRLVLDPYNSEEFDEVFVPIGRELLEAEEFRRDIEAEYNDEYE